MSAECERTGRFKGRIWTRALTIIFVWQIRNDYVTDDKTVEYLCCHNMDFVGREL